jgi:hypothetical protein
MNFLDAQRYRRRRQQQQQQQTLVPAASSSSLSLSLDRAVPVTEQSPEKNPEQQPDQQPEMDRRSNHVVSQPLQLSALERQRANKRSQEQQQQKQRSQEQKQRSQEHERIYQEQEERAQEKQLVQEQLQLRQQPIQPLQLPRETRASSGVPTTDPSARTVTRTGPTDPPAKKETRSIFGSGDDASYYASFLSMPVPNSHGGMMGVLELLSIDDDEDDDDDDNIGINKNIGNYNNNNNVNGNGNFDAAAAESKQHAADVAALAMSMLSDDDFDDNGSSDNPMFYQQIQKDIGALRGKVDDQLREMVQDSQKDVQQWNIQLQLLQQSRQQSQVQAPQLQAPQVQAQTQAPIITSLAPQQQEQQQQAQRQAQAQPQRLHVPAVLPKRKDLVASYNTPQMTKPIEAMQSDPLPYSQQQRQLRPSKQPPRPQPTQRMPPSLSARANELVSVRSVAILDSASSAEQSVSANWCLGLDMMESATKDLLLMSTPRAVQQPREVLEFTSVVKTKSIRQRRPIQQQPQQQPQPQPQPQQPVIHVLEPSPSRDVTVAAENLSWKRREKQDCDNHNPSYQQQEAYSSRDKTNHYAKMVGRSSDPTRRDPVPVESYSRQGANQSRLTREDPILSARRSKMVSEQSPPIVLHLEELDMLQERDEINYRVGDRRFHPDVPETPASTAAVVPTPRNYRASDSRFHPDVPETPASTAAVVPTPRTWQRPSKQSDSPPLTRVSSDLSLREESIRQDREERYQLEQQMKIQEEIKQKEYEELRHLQEELLQPRRQEQRSPEQVRQRQSKEIVQQQHQRLESNQGPRRFFPPDESANIREEDAADYEDKGITAEEVASLNCKSSKQQEDNDKEAAPESQSQGSRRSQKPTGQVESATFLSQEKYLEIIHIPTSPTQSDIIQVPTSPVESVEVSVWNQQVTSPASLIDENESFVQLPPTPNADRTLFHVQEQEYEGSSSDSAPLDYYYDNSGEVPESTDSVARSWTDDEPRMDQQEYEGSSSDSIPLDYYYDNSGKVPTDLDARSWTDDEPLMDRHRASKGDAPSVGPDSKGGLTDAPAAMRVSEKVISTKLSDTGQRNVSSNEVGSSHASDEVEDVSTRDKSKGSELINEMGSPEASEEVVAVRRNEPPKQVIMPIDVNRNAMPKQFDEPRRASNQRAPNEDPKEVFSSAAEDRRCESPEHFIRESAVAPSTPKAQKEDAHAYSPRSPDAKDDEPSHCQATQDVTKIEHVRLRALEDPYGDKGQYTGMLVRRKPHGQGTMQYEDGRCYTGDFKYGRWHGQGRALFSNGDLYVGEYDMDQRHGKGRYEWEDGRVYDGTFHRDQRQGTGTYTWADKAVYAGDFFAGQRHGQGTYQFSEGSVYVGMWQSGKYHGVGECEWADGRCYRGEWANGRAHGYGKETRPDGSVRHDGEWRNDRPVRAKK